MLFWVCFGGLYCLQMRTASERYELFIKRLELSDDPRAREYLRATNAQMLNGGARLVLD